MPFLQGFLEGAITKLHTTIPLLFAMNPLTLLASACRFCLNYRNPIQILMARSLNPHGLINVTDRASGVACVCKVQSYRMFGEVWHDRDYDIPKVPIASSDVVIDIGANQGFYSCYAASKGARVYAFEPSPESFERLTQNVQSNGFQNRVLAKCCAIGGRNGCRELFVSDELGGGRNTIQEAFATNAELSIRIKMPINVVSLAQVIEDQSIEKIRICKLDCEGSELEILSSLTAEITDQIDAFVIEFHPEAYAVSDLLALLCGWKTHHVSFAEDNYCRSQIVRAVHERVLLKN